MFSHMHQLHNKASIFELLRLADQFDVSEVSGKVQNMLFTRSDLRIFDKGEELWMAEKYGMKLLKMRVISEWSQGDSQKFLTREMCEDLSKNTVFDLLTRFS